MRISDWSSDVCSSDLYYLLATAMLPIGVGLGVVLARVPVGPEAGGRLYVGHVAVTLLGWVGTTVAGPVVLLWPTVLRHRIRSEERRGGEEWVGTCGAWWSSTN